MASHNVINQTWHTRPRQSIVINFNGQVTNIITNPSSTDNSIDYTSIIKQILSGSIPNHGTTKGASVCKGEEGDIIYERATDTVHILESGGWEEHTRKMGIMNIINKINDDLLVDYENYLIHKIETTRNNMIKRCCKEHLQECYAFMCCFDIKPRSFNMTDSAIMGSTQVKEDYTIAERCSKLYKRAKKNVTELQIDKVNKNIIDAIGYGTTTKLADVKRAVMKMIKPYPNYQIPLCCTG